MPGLLALILGGMFLPGCLTPIQKIEAGPGDFAILEFHLRG